MATAKDRQWQQAEFRDDDADGFKLRIVRSHDGDFWLSVIPHTEDMQRRGRDDELYAPCYSASIRVRTPLVGGGSHQALYDALVALWRQEGLL